MKKERKVQISYALYKCHERNQQLYGRYRTLVEAYEALRKMKFTTGSAIYDLVDYAELEEQVWVGNQWVHSETIGVYELSGTSTKMRVNLARIEKEYKELAKIGEKNKGEKRDDNSN